MTSTNIFSGINEGKRSSRVLRPPGGGQTDILGVHSQPVEAKPSRTKNQPTETKIMEEEKNDVREETKVEKVQSEPVPKEDPPKRVRVPPGGFSSGGFW